MIERAVIRGQPGFNLLKGFTLSFQDSIEEMPTHICDWTLSWLTLGDPRKTMGCVAGFLREAHLF